MLNVALLKDVKLFLIWLWQDVKLLLNKGYSQTTGKIGHDVKFYK